MNGLLAYISLQKSGTYGDIRDASEGLGFRARQALDTMSRLGHVEYRETSRGDWRCAKPGVALEPASRREGVLFGARSRELLPHLDSRATVDVVGQDRGPDVWRLSSDTPLPEVLGAAGGPLADLRMPSPSAAERLAYSLPDLSGYLESDWLFPGGRVGNVVPNTTGSAEWWDPGERQWAERNFRGVTAADGLWKMRKKFSGRPVHVLKRGHKASLVGDVEAAKLSVLPPSSSGIRYDAGERTLHIHTDFPLPRLYARALCLCRGTLPERRRGEKIFRGVPPVIAKTTVVRLGVKKPEGLTKA